ncbi:hypothetical protein ACU4GD_17135 [Cupriavidus basilensis]
MELLIDALARAVRREPWEIRCENLVQPGAMPYVNVTNKHFDGGDYPASVRKAAEMIGLARIRARQRERHSDASAGSRCLGVGFAHLHGAIGAWHFGVRRLGHAGDSRLRFRHRAHHAGRRA